MDRVTVVFGKPRATVIFPGTIADLGQLLGAALSGVGAFGPNLSQDQFMAASLSGTSAFGPGLSQDQLMDAALSSVGGLGAGLSQDQLLGAALSGAGGFGAGLSQDQRLAAALSGAGALTGDITRPLGAAFSGAGAFGAGLSQDQLMGAALSGAGDLTGDVDVGGASGQVTKSFLSSGSQANPPSSVVTFAGVGLGAADANRYIVVAITGSDSGGTGDCTLTVGGVAATQVAASIGTSGAFLFIAAVPTGTSGDIVVTFPDAMADVTYTAWRMISAGSATAYDSGSSTATPPSISLNVPAGGAAFSAMWAYSSAAGINWTGLTEDEEHNVTGSKYETAASGEFATQQTGLTITADITGSYRVGVAASWGP